MDIRKGWNELQNKLYEFKGYKGLVECSVFYDCKLDKFTFSFDAFVSDKQWIIYCGIWSKRADYHKFYQYMTTIKHKFFLFTPDDLDAKERKKQVNGCGSGWNAKLVPDFIFYPCCCKHDSRYFLCPVKTDENRKWIDTLFFWDMKRRAEGRWYYVLIACKFFIMVRLLGGRAFKG